MLVMLSEFLTFELELSLTMRKTIFLSVIFTCFVFSGQQTIKGPGCLDLKAQENFDQAKYTGRWFEHSITPYSNKEDILDCVFYDNFMPVDGYWWVGKSYVVDRNNSKYLHIGYATIDSPGKGLTIDGDPYTIVGTNYNNYSVVYICKDFVTYRQDVVKILARDQIYVDHATVLDIVYANHLDDHDNVHTRQTDCPTDWSDETVIDDTEEDGDTE